MNEVFENILERIDSYIEDAKSEGDFSYIKPFEIAKIAVQGVAEEYNGGWISCSDRLPEIRQDCLVTVRYTGFMGMHGFWVKTGHMESENDWWGDCSGGEVIAWQPLPEPYHPKGE